MDILSTYTLMWHYLETMTYSSATSLPPHATHTPGGMTKEEGQYSSSSAQ